MTSRSTSPIQSSSSPAKLRHSVSSSSQSSLQPLYLATSSSYTPSNGTSSPVNGSVRVSNSVGGSNMRTNMNLPKNRSFYVLLLVLVLFMTLYTLTYVSMDKYYSDAFSNSYRKEKGLQSVGSGASSLAEVTRIWLSSYTSDYTLQHMNKLYHAPHTVPLNEFMDLGISQIVSNQSKLEEFHPFSLATGINVWDLYPPVASCPDIRRLGRLGDGGKWICGMSLLTSRIDKPCLVYSFGISTDASFEEEILLRTSCMIYAFDPSIGSLPKPSFIDLIYWDELKRTRIIFHKLALSDSSGSSKQHALMAHLYDIMNRYNHSYIDILKVDIEGAEWLLFDDLFQNSNKERTPLPVGQLLIELHYQSMTKTNNFFKGMQSLGFLPYSREINLQPCLAGGKPVAVEYSFIHPEHVHIREHQLYQPRPDKSQSLSINSNYNQYFKHSPMIKSKDWHKEINGLVYILSQMARFDILKYTLSEFYDKVYRPYKKYPVIIFHDDIDEKHQRILNDALPGLNLRFITVNFTIPKHLNAKDIPTRTTCAPKSSTLGYRHMCRFQAHQVHEILFSMMEYSHVEYILRLDDDSLFTASIGYDLFEFMKLNNKLYGFVNIVADDPKCVTGLWNASKSFLEQSKFDVNGTFMSDWDEPNVFYNNFEISHTSVWKNPLWKAYSSYIDNLGGIYIHRWGDAPIHSIGVSFILSKSQVHAFSDIGYRHYPFVDQIPTGLPMPLVDPFIPAHEQDCKYYSHWSCTTKGNYSSNSTIKAIANQITHDSMDYYDGVANSVMFTFGHKGREYLLIETLNNFYENYIRHHPVPVVIFYNEAAPLDILGVKKYIPFIQNISFMPITLKNVSVPMGKECGSMNPEVRGAVKFLTLEAFDLLHDSLGYVWFFRFGDDSRLDKVVRYNLFRHLYQESKYYGYVSAVREHAKCVHSLWRFGLDMCESFSKKSSPFDPCSELLHQWPENIVFFNNFEISYYSIWRSQSCSNFVKSLDQSPPNTISNKFLRKLSHDKESEISKQLTDSSNNGSIVPYLSDAAIHTLCVSMSLSPDQIHRFVDVDYKVFLSPSIPYYNISTGFKQSDSSQAVKSQVYDVQSLESSFDEIFHPKRFGWLGGDVSASIALPPRHNDEIKRYIWLFGDTLIGTSSDKRRNEGVLISNSIGIGTIGPSKVGPIPSQSSSDISIANKDSKLNMRFFWNDDSNGNPQPIFRPFDVSEGMPSKQRDAKYSNPKVLFWPLGGVGINIHDVELSKSNQNLIVFGQFVVPSDASSIEEGMVDQESLQESQSPVRALLFDALSSAMIRVTNPYDSPNMWQYDHILFPDTKEGSFQWFAAAQSNGEDYASMKYPCRDNQFDDVVYILGSYAKNVSDVYSNILKPANSIKSSSKGLNSHQSQSNRFHQPFIEDLFFVSSDYSYQVVARMKSSDMMQLNMSQFEILSTCVSSNAVSSSQWLSIEYYQSNHNPSVMIRCQPKSIFESMIRVSEGSLYYDKDSKRWYVVSLQVPETSVQLCQSPFIEGPWTCERIMDIPEPWSDSNQYVTYGAKMHPELMNQYRSKDKKQANGSASKKAFEMVISIVSNTKNGFLDLFAESNYLSYAPKFYYVSKNITNP